MKFDIVIIGAGPAGLLAAWCLEGTGISYTVIEKGNVYFKRDKELPYAVYTLPSSHITLYPSSMIFTSFTFLSKIRSFGIG